jgi:hypothetical protein
MIDPVIETVELIKTIKCQFYDICIIIDDIHTKIDELEYDLTTLENKISNKDEGCDTDTGFDT